MARYLSTNNRLKRVNKTLKDDDILRVELGMAEFLNKVEESVASVTFRYMVSKGGPTKLQRSKNILLEGLDRFLAGGRCKSPNILFFGANSPEAYLVPAQ